MSQGDNRSPALGGPGGAGLSGNEPLIGGAAALHTLLLLLRRGDSYEARRALDRLVALGEPALEHLISALGEEEPDLRVLAARGLELLADPRALNALTGALGSTQDGPLRFAVIRALGAIGQARSADCDSLPLLLHLLHDSACLPIHRGEICETLGRFGDARAIPALIEALEASEGSEVRTRAALALGRIGQPHAIPALRRAALKDPHPGVREQARRAIEQIEAARRSGQADSVR